MTASEKDIARLQQDVSNLWEFILTLNQQIAELKDRLNKMRTEK